MIDLPKISMEDPRRPFSFVSELVVFRDEDDEIEEDDVESDHPRNPSTTSTSTRNPTPAADPTPSAAASSPPRPPPPPPPSVPLLPPCYVNTEPHVSSQFYTFNAGSHSLMVRCILDRRLATPDEIRSVTSPEVLRSWRSVWKDRNEDTAYVTAWKRIQDKLGARPDPNPPSLFFKSNPSQLVSHVEQWQDIVLSSHSDSDLKHLGLKDTIDRIKQSWTVGAKFYGIPESFIRVCISACPVCSGASASSSAHLSALAARNKRKRFEYTDSFEVPAKDVPRRLQQLAAKHKVVLCIRQKYIRYKPFMAEVKDYACHRAGEPTGATSALALGKRSGGGGGGGGGPGSSASASGGIKREPYQSKRCGCGFRIRAIVPIANYNEKDKTFVYQEEGMAVFKLYAVHSGHEPGPLDGSARIIHRVVGHKAAAGFDGAHDGLDAMYGIHEESDDFQLSLVLQQLQDIKAEAGVLESKIMHLPHESLSSLLNELTDITNRLRSLGGNGEDRTGSTIGGEPVEGVMIGKQSSSDEILVSESDLNNLDDRDFRVYSDKDAELIDDGEHAFDDEVLVPWDENIEADCRGARVLMRETCKVEKWYKEFDEKSILDCHGDDVKLMKSMGHDGTIVADSNLVGMQVDGFYSDNAKWYESACLDPGADCGDGGFRDGGIV
ncbi:hypothetical protein QJS04_geneDACA020620 [Acorus gramineus]|uniref:Uncharacterized protein n=1 Tax=Acorus gramineus TaxID=55184 RepID=A0AAV9B7B8_ACOGR|nr:hypothetical protein QJS04_geneDACA020620 [Acorus gramineus]